MKAISTVIIKVVTQHVRMLSARLVSSVPLAERDSYMRASIHLFRLMIHTFGNDVFEDSDVFGARLCQAV